MALAAVAPVMDAFAERFYAPRVAGPLGRDVVVHGEGGWGGWEWISPGS